MLKTYMNPLHSESKKFTYNKINVGASSEYNLGYGYLFYLLNSTKVFLRIIYPFKIVL